MSISQANSQEEFDSFIKTDGLAVAYFYASWAKPSIDNLSTIEEAAAKFPGVAFAKIDIDENQESAEEYEIDRVPARRIFKGGSVVEEEVIPTTVAGVLESLQ